MLPLGGSAQSQKVLAYSRILAERWNAEIVLLRAVDPLASKSLQQEILRAAQEYLQDQAQQLPHVSTRAVSLVGPAREVIRAQAVKEKCDLIMFAPHAYGRIVRWFIGSVAEEVAHIAPCPVLLVRGEPDPEIRHLVVPVDGSAISYSVLDRISPYTTAQTRITVLHCSGIPQDEALLNSTTGCYLKRLRSEMEGMVASRPNTTLHIVERPAPEGILEWLRGSDCNLVAVSTHGNGGISHLYAGNVADQVAREAACPVLIFPPGSD